MDNPFEAQKEQQLLRLRWASVKENVFLVRLHISWWRTDSEHSHFLYCESEAWRALREWSVAASVGYLVPKKASPFLEEIFSSLRQEFFLERDALLKKIKKERREDIYRPFKFGWVKEEIIDSLASDRQREEIVKEVFLKPRRILVEAIGNAEKTGRRFPEEIIEKAVIFNIVGDYIFTRYIERLKEAFQSKNALRIKSAFAKIKEDFQVRDEPEPQEEGGFPLLGNRKPLIRIRRYRG